MIHLPDIWTTPQLPFVSICTNKVDDILHDHPFFEIFYIVDGSLQHVFNGVTETLTTGDVYFLNPEDAHCFLREKGNTTTHRDIVMRKEFFKNLMFRLLKKYYIYIECMMVP